MKVFLLRHGKVDIINNEFFRSHLSKEGKDDVYKLANNSIFNDVKTIYTSSFNRAVDTAKIFSETLNLPINVEKKIDEWKLQSLNHPNYPEEEKKGWEDVSYKGVSGESLLDVRKRALAFLHELSEINPPGDILLVTHGCVVEMVSSYLSDRYPTFESLKKHNYLYFIKVEIKNKDIKLIEEFEI